MQPAPGAHGAAGGVPSPHPSPRKALRLKISLIAFCERYGISDSDRDKLVRMDYQPGLASVEKAQEEYWKSEGFTPLTWTSFLDAHKLFLKDVSNGRWDDAAA